MLPEGARLVADLAREHEIVWLTLVWVLLWGTFTPLSIVGGKLSPQHARADHEAEPGFRPGANAPLLPLECIAPLVAALLGISFHAPHGIVSTSQPLASAAGLAVQFPVVGTLLMTGALVILSFRINVDLPFWEQPLGNLQRMVMPAFVLGNAIAAVLMRHTRSAMLQVLSADYVRTARAKGLSERVVHLVEDGPGGLRHGVVDAVGASVTVPADEGTRVGREAAEPIGIG